MDILVVGSGAREHALLWKLAQSESVTKLHVAPGNPGLEAMAKRHEIDLHDIDAIADLAKKLKVDLVIIADEVPLVAGLSNRLKRAEISCLGASAAASRVEGSKVFAKELMDRAQIPTARWEPFSDVQAALAAINRWRGPVVIKADGLTGGRGSYVCMTKPQAERALTKLLVDSAHGVAGRRVVVEEFLQGFEASIMVLSDGENVVPLPAVAPFKRRNDGDLGLNTAGMGAHTPVEELDEFQVEEVIESCLKPAIDDLRERGLPYVGVLCADVMFTSAGPKVLEFNCRMGNPEAQTLMAAFEDVDIADLFLQAATGMLAGVETPYTDLSVVSINVVAAEYPEQEGPAKPLALPDMSAIDALDNIEIFFSDIEKVKGGKKVNVVGGHAFTITATGDDMGEAAQAAYSVLNQIDLTGLHARRDIAEAAVALV